MPAATAPPEASSGSTARATSRTRKSSSPISARPRRATHRSARSASRSAAARSGTRSRAACRSRRSSRSITWTNLATALAPQGLSKSGLVQLARGARADEPVGPRSSSPRPAGLDDERGPGATTALAASRSAALEARVDHDPDTADPGPSRLPLRHRPGARGVRRLNGPKRIYLGDLGHSPGTEPTAAENAAIYGPRPCKWFDRFLKGTPNGIDKQRRSCSRTIRGTARPTAFTTLPATKTISRDAAGHDDDVRRRRQGRAQRARHRRAARDVRRLDRRRPLLRRAELGPPRRRARGPGSATPITAGGVKLSAASGKATIKLMNESVRCRPARGCRSISARPRSPRAARTRSISRPCSRSAQITIGRVTLNALRPEEGGVAMIRVVARRSGRAARGARGRADRRRRA